MGTSHEDSTQDPVPVPLTTETTEAIPESETGDESMAPLAPSTEASSTDSAPDVA
jgi:hypothetical protein